jgi:UDP-2,4-diacetamido-2,4,6-trideoxy-beta-L-altropyranose hydrolase
MNVGLVADGGPFIGYGHIFRSLAIAKELKRRGNKIFLLTTSNDIEKIIQGEFQIINIGTPGNIHDTISAGNTASEEQLAIEISEIKKIVTQHEIEVLIVDSYNVSEHYFIKLKEFVPIMCYIDDLNKYKFSVDILINGNSYGGELEYESFDTKTKFLLGPRYTILRDEFQGSETIKINKHVNTISVLIGGSDRSNFITHLIDLINNDPDLKKYQYNIFIGPGFSDDVKKQIRDFKFDNIIIHEDLFEIKNILLNSDMALSGGGSTLYELVSLGLPALSIIFAENQELNVETLHEQNCTENLGWFDKLTDADLKSKVLALAENFERRSELQKNQLHLIDGKGVKRIVDEMERLYNSDQK